MPGLRPGPELIAAREQAFGRLKARVHRVEDAGLLGRKSVYDAALEFNAMLEGLANAELRGSALRILPQGQEERAWHDALSTVVHGFRITG